MIAQRRTAETSPFRRILQNAGQLVGGKIAAGLISLVYMALAARYLGVAGYGTLNLVHGFVAFVGGVVAFSGYQTVVKFGAGLLNGKIDTPLKPLRQLFWLMALVEFAMAALAISVAISLVSIAGRQMEWNPEALAFGPYYCLAILATVRTTPHGILQLAGRFDLLAIHALIMPVTRLLGVAMVVMFEGDFLAFLLVWLIASFAEGISMWIMGLAQLNRLGAGLIPSFAPTDTVGRHEGLMRFAAITNAEITMREFAPRITPLILGWVIGPAAVGLYSLSARIAAVLVQPAQLLGQASFAVIARLFAQERDEEASEAVWRAVRSVTAASLVLAGLLALVSTQILTLVGGREFSAASGLLMILLAGNALASGAPVLSSALTALGRPGKSAIAGLISNILLLPLLPPLLWCYGHIGSGLHMALQSAVSIMLLAIFYRRYSAQAMGNRS